MNILEVQVLADRIAQDFVSSGTDLNQGIAKLASERDLSRSEIHTLVAAANHAANDHFRKVAEDKTYTFDMANLDSVISLLDTIPESGADITKVASVITGFHSTTNEYADLIKQAAAGSEEDQRRRERQTRQTLHKIASLAEVRSRDLRAETQVKLAELDKDIDALTSCVKEYILQKRASYGDILKYASHIRVDNPGILSPLFDQVANRLIKMGEPFTGQLADHKELAKETFERNGINVPEPKVTVINGDVPIHKLVTRIGVNIEDIGIKKYMTHEIDSLNSSATVAEKGLPTSAAAAAHVVDGLDSFYQKFKRSNGDGSHEKLAEFLAEACGFKKEAGPVGAVARGVLGLAQGVGDVAAAPFRAAGSAVKGARVARQAAPKVVKGGKAVVKGGTKAARGISTVAGSGSLARDLGRATPSVVAAAAGGKVLSAGGDVLNKARKGVSYSSGDFAADAADKNLS